MYTYMYVHDYRDCMVLCGHLYEAHEGANMEGLCAFEGFLELREVKVDHSPRVLYVRN